MHFIKISKNALIQPDCFFTCADIIFKNAKNEMPLYFAIEGIEAIHNQVNSILEITQNGEPIEAALAELFAALEGWITPLAQHFASNINIQSQLYSLLENQKINYQHILTSIHGLGSCPSQAYKQLFELNPYCVAQILFIMCQDKDIKAYLCVNDAEDLKSHPMSPQKITLIYGLSANPFGHTTLDEACADMACRLSATSYSVYSRKKGMYTADPGLVPDALLLPQISLSEAQEVSFYDDAMVQSQALHQLLNHKVQIRLAALQDFETCGTEIVLHSNPLPYDIKIITYKKAVSVLTIIAEQKEEMIGRILELACESAILSIGQTTFEYGISFVLDQKQAHALAQNLENSFSVELKQGKIKSITCLDKQAVLCVVGDQMRLRCGILGKICASLGNNAINIVAIAQGPLEKCICIVIQENDVERAIAGIHHEFFHPHL